MFDHSHVTVVLFVCLFNLFNFHTESVKQYDTAMDDMNSNRLG